MNIYHNELIGFEAMLPVEVIELLHLYKTAVNDFSKDEDCMNMDNSLLDEHELAMAA